MKNLRKCKISLKRGFRLKIQPPIASTSVLKKRLASEFEDTLGFYSTGRVVIVYSSDMNPLEYTAATLKGHGLRDEDLVRACAKMIRRKIEIGNKDEDDRWPYTPDELLSELQQGPMQDLYNLIYGSFDPNYKINEHGYAVTRSRRTATKVWSMASDWEIFLMPKKRNAKQVLSGMTVHRLTSSKQSVVMLHKMDSCISYNDILEQNRAWALMVSGSSGISKEMVKGTATHATTDNNDGCQDTMTGKGTTHDTNCTLFQPILPGNSCILCCFAVNQGIF